jgi:hypothetical protein
MIHYLENLIMLAAAGAVLSIVMLVTTTYHTPTRGECRFFRVCLFMIVIGLLVLAKRL